LLHIRKVPPSLTVPLARADLKPSSFFSLLSNELFSAATKANPAAQKSIGRATLKRCPVLSIAALGGIDPPFIN
jgi:hypothetical protein